MYGSATFSPFTHATHLAYFHSSAIVNKAAINICVPVFLSRHAFSFFFQVYNNLLTIVTKLCSRSQELTHLITQSTL